MTGNADDARRQFEISELECTGGSRKHSDIRRRRRRRRRRNFIRQWHSNSLREGRGGRGGEGRGGEGRDDGYTYCNRYVH